MSIPYTGMEEQILTHLHVTGIPIGNERKMTWMKQTPTP